jgi:hypothetical protein
MAVMRDRSDIDEALAAVQAFGTGPALTARIADLETRLQGKTRDKAAALLAADHIDETALSGALTIKQLSAQIDVVIHALGILTSLPYAFASTGPPSRSALRSSTSAISCRRSAGQCPTTQTSAVPKDPLK